MTYPIPLFRALNVAEEKKIKEEIYLGSNKEIADFSEQDLASAHSKINRHILKGNTIKNDEIMSLTLDFNVALNYAKPHVLLDSYRNVFSVKIHRSLIAVFNSETIKDNILSLDDINKYDKSKKIGARAQNYAISTKEKITTGRLNDFCLLKKMHQDLLALHSNNNTKFFKILNYVIHPENQQKIHTFFEGNLTTQEKLIYTLFYVKNLNFYEVIAPIYYFNTDANLYCIYDAVFSTLNDILNKVLTLIELDANLDYTSSLFKLYCSELNVLCINPRNEVYKSTLNLNILKYIYPLATQFLKSEETTFTFKEQKNKLETYLNSNYRDTNGDKSDLTDCTPLFLYLPKLGSRDRIANFPRFYSSRNENNIHFFHNKLPKEIADQTFNHHTYVGKNILISSNGDPVFQKDLSKIERCNPVYNAYFDLSLYAAELYIEPNCSSLNPKFFLNNYDDIGSFNFMLHRGEDRFTSSVYNLNRHKLFKKINSVVRYSGGHEWYNTRLLVSHADRLCKVFGGILLTQDRDDYTSNLEYRTSKRFYKREIANELKLYVPKKTT